MDVSTVDLSANYLGIRKNSLAYTTAIAAVMAPGTPIPVGKNGGSGRFSYSKEWTLRTTQLLKAAGIEYEVTNVSPKGGRAGLRITVKQ